MPFYYDDDDDDDDNPFYKKKLGIRNGNRYDVSSRVKEISSSYEVARTSYQDSAKISSYEVGSNRVTSYQDSVNISSYQAKISSFQPYNFTSSEPKGSAGIVSSGCTSYKDYNKYAGIKIEAKMREETNSNSVKTLIESETKFTSSYQPYNDTSSVSKGSAGIVSSGKDYDKYAGIDPKFEAKTRAKIEENTNGFITKIETGGSCEIGINEQKAELDYKSSIQKDEYTYFQSEGSVKVKTGIDSNKVEANLSSTIFKVGDEDENIKFLSGTAGVKLENNAEMVKLNVSLMETKGGVVNSKIGCSLDTGVSADKNGIEVKGAGIGFKLGKEISISTPFAEVSLDLVKLKKKIFD